MTVPTDLDRSFRVFRNNRYAFIDPREAQPDLTELLEVRDDEPFILHPGEFVCEQRIMGAGKHQGVDPLFNQWIQIGFEHQLRGRMIKPVFLNQGNQ